MGAMATTQTTMKTFFMLLLMDALVSNEDCPKEHEHKAIKIMMSPDDDKWLKDAAPSQLVTRGVNKFGRILFKNLENSNNLVFSPFSLSTALAMLTPGAKGNTLKEITESLSLPSHLDAMAGYRCLLDKSPKYAVSTANRIFINEKIHPKKK